MINMAILKLAVNFIAANLGVARVLKRQVRAVLMKWCFTYFNNLNK